MSPIMDPLSPDNMDPTRKITMDTWKNVLRPYMSPSLPHSGVDTVDVSKYAVTIHAR